MRTATFKKGIHVPHSKFTARNALVECPAPETVRIPLAQHIGKPAAPCVEVGDEVKVGTLIGKADGFVSSNIYSSVSGKVTALERYKTTGGKCTHVVIANDGKYDEVFLPPLADRSRESILARISEAGLVGMGGAGFPTHVKYQPKTPVDTFIINAAECEPYITCDHRLMVEYTDKVLRGGKILAELLGLSSFYFGVEDNKPDAIGSLEKSKKELGIDCNVVALKSKYPQGAEKQLIYAITKRKVPTGGLPADVGCVVGNVHTAYALFDAVENNRPLYRRALTVCGGGVAAPKNLWVRVGTSYSDVVDFCGGVKDDCVKIISGGPMMGFALPDTDYAVGKTTGSVLFLTGAEANTLQPSACINCAKCAKACPMNLMPMYIDLYTQRGDFATANKYGAMNCIECGCCAFTCPAKRPIVQSVRLCKRKLKEASK